MKGSQVLGILVAIALIIFGIVYPIPEKHLRVSSSSYSYSFANQDKTWLDESGESYVGGDAYNYQMEASLKAGYMSGVLAMKSISVASGLLLFFVTLYSRIKCATIENQTHLLKAVAKAVTQQNETLNALFENAEGQVWYLNNLSANLERLQSNDEGYDSNK